MTHKVWGIPIFLFILFGIFHLTFSENFLFLGSILELPTLEDLGFINENGEFLNFGITLLSLVYDGVVYSPGIILFNLMELITGGIISLVGNLLVNTPEWVNGFLCDGILGGLSAILSFLPQILVLFLLFSILEDSGYMARIAFILDKLLRIFGLSGRALMPMIMGFGCSVPAMINTRTLSDEKEKTATIRVIPFFSCSAKLPILTAIAGVIVTRFGIGNADLITYSMYLLGMITAVVSVLVMRSTTLKGETPPFIMELPTYHLPQFSSLMRHLWDKAKHFIEKAFTIILASTIIIWVISHFSFSWEFLTDEQINQSILAQIGMFIQPLFTPLGFGSQLGEWGWVFAVACITGLIAKENVISTFGTLACCIVGALIDVEIDGGVIAVEKMVDITSITVPALISFIAFNMTTIPCFATVATAKAELVNKKRFNYTLLFWIITSYLLSTFVYLVLSWWWTLFIFVILTIITVFLIKLKK